MSSLPPIKAATVEFVDIAGLVKGASEGAGLGNKFLSHIREVRVIAHVVRAFIDENVIREGSSDPESDYATIQTELMIADMQTMQKALENRKLPPLTINFYKKVLENLEAGIPARQTKVDEEEKILFDQLFLLTSKPEVIVLNVSEDDYSLVNNQVMIERYANLLQLSEQNFVVICAKIESELAALDEDEQKMYLHDLGFPTSGLERLITKAYDRLGLISFLTAGEKEVRAWTIKKGITAQMAAGVIHNDFVKKFIKADVVDYESFVSLVGWKACREQGKVRSEGRDYIMKDGDIVEFKIGA
jgi:GTP-binding protein YchF